MTEQIFATGVFLEPFRTIVDGKKVWIWRATRFVNKSYKDGEYFDPDTTAKTKEALLAGIPEEE